MKNKKMTFILILSVASVWGIIFYKVFAATSGSEDHTPRVTLRPIAFEPLDEYTRTDSFSLSLNYPDPFLKNAVSIEARTTEEVAPENTSLSVNTRPMPLIPAKPAVNWNGIKYSGYIHNPGSKSIACILSVNGKELMLSEGEAAEGLKLLKSGRDSVKVLYQQNTKFIKLEI